MEHINRNRNVNKIDKALGEYYKQCNCDDYYNEDMKGKFLDFVDANGIEEKQIDLQFKDEMYKDNPFIDFDNNFPLISTVDNNKDRNQMIFDVIQYCYKHGIPPPQSTYRQQIDNNANNIHNNNLPTIQPIADKIYECKSVKNCECIQRTMNSIHYFNTLNIENNEDDKNKFIAYCKQKHDSLFHDHIHIVVTHTNNSDLDEIMKFMKCNCEINNCKLAMRYHGNMQHDIDDHASAEDSELIFYRNIMDQMHNILFHLYDTGMRVKRYEQWNIDDIILWISSIENGRYKNYLNELRSRFEEHNIACGIHLPGLNENMINIKSNGNDQTDLLNHFKQLKHGNIDHIESNKNKWVDATFSYISCIIKAKKDILVNNIKSRFGNGKFNITKNKTKAYESKREKHYTFMDGLCAFMNENKISKRDVECMNAMFENEDYDTEAITMDVDIQHDIPENKQSNIGEKNSTYYNVLRKYIYQIKLYHHTFHPGYRLYYWEYYRKRAKQFFVELKYQDIKEEILSNNICKLGKSKLDISLNKTKKYIETNEAKKIISHLYPASNIDKDKLLHYDIKAGSQITFNHLLAITLYCDWDELSTKFSATFRNGEFYESISCVIRKNREFFHWSKLLRETVEIFGYNAEGQGKGYNSSKWNNKLQGPFFCGMSFLMVMPEYDIKLNGPTSTSECIEVATSFAVDGGIVIQLNNIGTGIISRLCAFNCSWLSDYSSEREWLFCGGQYTIKIETIMNIGAEQDYAAYFNSLHYFDCMLNGNILNCRNDND
eukprot:421185_1